MGLSTPLLLAVIEAVLLHNILFSTALMTAEELIEFKMFPWFDWVQAYQAYNAEYSAAQLLGKNSASNPDRLKFYPDNRVLEGEFIVVFCLLSPERNIGYRSNRVSLQILQLGFTHQRLLLAPKRRLLSAVEELNCWNYVQESVCKPTRDCAKPRDDALKTVGLVTKEGWGIFQLKASNFTQGHYQCVSEMQNVLQADAVKTKTSDVVLLQVFKAGIGMPDLTLKPGYPRGQPLSASCAVQNSKPTGSEFVIELVLMRPPPAGSPGKVSMELLTSLSVTPGNPRGELKWLGEVALLSHHGLIVHCRVTNDWGSLRGRRIATGRFQVLYMFPAYLDNPRVRHEMAMYRFKARHSDFYKSPEVASLRPAEYIVCRADGYPDSQISWSTSKKSHVWILNETLFISSFAKAGDLLDAQCVAKNSELNLSDTIEVKIRITADAARFIGSGAKTFFLAMTPVLALMNV